jgi:hypothetical protein
MGKDGAVGGPFIEWALTKGPCVAYINMLVEHDALRAK